MNQNDFFEQATQITKAYGYDILAAHVKELKAENEILKIELKAANNMLEAYKGFVNEVRPLFGTKLELANNNDDLKDINI